MSWTDIDFVVFDLEANNDRSDPPQHEIIEIGAVLVSAGAEVDAFETTVRPTRRLRDFTRELTGLTDEDLAHAPRPAEALRDFYDFVEGRPMIAHNGLRYDFPLLQSAGAKAGVPAPAAIRLDTLELAHLAFPRAGAGITADIDGRRPPRARSLDELARFLLGEEPRPRHRALGDAQLLLRVLIKMLAVLDGEESDRRLQRWVLGTGGHPWAHFLAHQAEPVLLEGVVPQPVVARRGPTSGRFEPAVVAAMFDEGGALMGRAREPRRQQMDMARHVAGALDTRARRLIEAPTGTGKTLAYLVPAIEHARARGGTVAVAPHSKVLQDQIMATLEELSGELEPFVSVVVKGRSNYVNLEALAGELDDLAATAQGAHLREQSENVALAMVCGWVAKTPTGDWDDLRAGALEASRSALGNLRRRLRMEEPLGPALTRLDELDFHRRARQLLRHAHVAVLNHALVVSDQEWSEHARSLVLDEAHNLEDAATDALSESVGRYDLLALCDALWDPTRRRGTVLRLADAAGWPLGAEPADGIEDREEPRDPGLADGMLPAAVLDRIQRCVDEVRSACERFGDELVAYLRARTGAAADSRYAVSYRIRRGIDTRHPDYRKALDTGRQLRRSLEAVRAALNDVNLPADLARPYRRDRLEAEMRRLGRAARHASNTIDAVLWAQDPQEQLTLDTDAGRPDGDAALPTSDAEEWIAIGEITYDTDARLWVWELRRSPVSVGPRLRDVWQSLDSAVLTSATLRVNGSFGHVIDSLGLEPVEEPIALTSPFPWLVENHLLLLADYLPAPRSRLMEEFKASAAAEVPRLLMLTGGRGLALMTARARMEFVRDHARPVLDAEGVPLLAQGDDSAPALVERMRAERSTSLIALRSFWEGVDIPGEALSLLMIEKIPFDSPADPVVGARMEAMDQRGKDPFADYLVPRAALRFAQGVGRLIRTETDRGVTMVLDSRLCRALPYRDALLGTLPGPPRRERVGDPEQGYQRIAAHLGDIDLDDSMIQRLRTVKPVSGWPALEELSLSDDDRADGATVAERLERVRQAFGFEQWRPGQFDIMRSFIGGSDFLALLPTGSGKSVTFQIPALLSRGLTLVVSPLKALMNDQVENLRARGITGVAAVHSGVGQAEWRDVLRGARRGDYKLLYISPERLWSQEFVDELSRIGVDRIAVDEAHCISQWGHSFRPEYAAIPDALRHIALGGPRPPILAVTATANKRVRDDIEGLLGLDLSSAPVTLSPDRPEIQYLVESCRNRADRDVRVVQIVEAFRSRPAIVYVPTRRDTARVSGLLRAAGHVARPYHGAMDDSERLNTEDAFRHGELDLVVATKAFGMGIDKPDIALIVHLEMPATIEEYVQETGRAARGASEDNGPERGTAVLLTTPGDCSIHRVFVKGAAPGVEQVRRVWARIRVGTHVYDPDELDRDDDDGGTDQESAAAALAVHYLQEDGAVTRHLDTPWRGRVTVVSDTAERLEELSRAEPDLAERGHQFVELIGRSGIGEYRAEDWSERLARPAAATASDLFELNGRDILGFSVWKHAWTLERSPGAEPAWPAIEERAAARTEEVQDKSRQAKAFARRRSGCRVRVMLEYFGVAAAEKCVRCDLCARLDRPWGDSHISRDGLLAALPSRGIVLRLVDDTTGDRFSRRRLRQALIGDRGSSDHALPKRLAEHHLYGRLAFLGADAVDQVIDRLINEDLVRAVAMEHDGTSYESLEITQQGRKAL